MGPFKGAFKGLVEGGFRIDVVCPGSFPFDEEGHWPGAERVTAAPMLQA